MGDTQSAQREGKKDAAAEEESGKVDDAQTGQNNDDKPLKNINEINGKADGSIAEVNGHCEDEIAAEAILSQGKDVSETAKPLKEEETPKVEINEKESPNKANEDVPVQMTEMDAKQNNINEGFKRFFSNIGLKLTVKQGSSEITTDVADETNEKEPNIPEDVEEGAKETKSENSEAEQSTDVNIAQETYDNDSTTCPTLTDGTSEDVLENAAEKTTEAREAIEPDIADAAATSPVEEDAQQGATPEEEPQSTSPSSPEGEAAVSPIKRFFTTGIFSGLRKKKKPAEDETTEKELVDMAKKEVIETTEQTVQGQQQDKEISPGVETAVVEAQHKENEIKEDILSAVSAPTTDEGKSSSTDPTTMTVTEPGILNSQEKDKVQASPLKRLLSGSSLKKLSKKQRSRKSSDAKLSDSGEHVSDQLLSSTESAENQKEGPAQPPAGAAGEEDGAWASFKKLVTPKKRMKRPNEETQIPGAEEELKPSEGQQISDHSTEESKKRKDSPVSWDAVLCGSGRRRSRKTSDSEDETPEIDNNEQRQDGGPKHGAESPLESSTENENEILASSPKQAGSPSEGDGGSTWRSLKKLVTPKRKAKDEDESKDNIQSDSEVTQDESSFSIKKLLPGRKKKKSAEKQDQVSSDEADKDVASGDEDSETPAVVPLSEFDTVETEVHVQTQADVESHLPEQEDSELQQGLLDQMAEPILPCDSLQTEAKEVQDNEDALEKQATPATNDESDDLTESISKHQQLSDIPEEGIITETTPASVTEEAARDDTIAEDLIEITSEAITAPEPASDITVADETEMISAVSQLSSESSKTSGNTTPVPAEYDVMETDALLHQVVETISISPKAVTVFSDELSPEKIVGSVSHQILETSAKEEPTILEIHRKFDATAISTGLKVEELDPINELVATPQTESLSEVNDSISTEVVSEVATEEFDTAEIGVDEVHEINIRHPEESIKELERIDESHHLVECLSEVKETVSTDILPEGEETVPDIGSLVEAHEAQTEPPKMDSQEGDSAATVADETQDGAMEQEVQTVTEKGGHIDHTNQIQAEDEDQPPVKVEELQELAAVQAATLDSEEGNVQALEKEVSEDIPVAETVTYELEEEIEPPTEVSVEPEKEDKLETEAAKTEHVQEPEALEAVQASTLDSQESGIQSPEEEVKSEDIPPAETAITDEPKQIAEHLSEFSVEPENTEVPVKAVKPECVQEPELLEVVQAPTLDSKEGSVQSLETEVISEDVPEAEPATDEPKQETIPLAEVNLEPVDASKTEPEVLQAAQEATLDSGADSLLSHEKEVTSADIPAVETVTDESKQETEERAESVEPVEAAQTEHVQESEPVPPDVKEIVTETKTEEEALTYAHAVPESIEEGGAQELEKQISLEDIPKPDADNVIASVTDGIESEVVVQQSQALEITEDQKTERIPQDVQVEQEDGIPDVVGELQTLTAIHVSSINEEACNVQVIEKAVFSEETPAPCVDNAAVTDEPKHEVHLSEVAVSAEGAKESELPGTKVQTASVEHAVVVEVVVCNLKDVAIPDVLVEKTSDVTEPLIDQVACELMVKEEVETVPPLKKDDVAETAEESSTVVMMHVPSVMFEDNHRIQVQVVDVDIKSAEATVDSVLDVGVTEAKELIDVCHETVEKVDTLSATPQIEEELIKEENKVTIEEVIQHVKENLPETVSESAVINLEQEVMKQPDAETKVSEMVESAGEEVEDQKAVEDSLRERQDEEPAIISDDSSEQRVPEDLMQTPDVPGSLGVSIHDRKEDLEETKAELEKPEVGVKAEEVKLSSGELDVKEIHEKTQTTQIAQSSVVTPSNTRLVVPQNTGIISSIGNVESPSSLSLEFKLNIQFGQAKAPASPPPIERISPMKQTEVSLVGVQAVEAVEPAKPTQKAESQNQTALTDVTVHAAEVTEPAANLDSTETAVIATQPILLDASIQAMETVEPEEQIKSTERVTSSAQATETIEPVKPTEIREVFLSPPVVSEACDQKTKAEEPIKQTEEENDQDVWMDAEEVIQEEIEVPLQEVEEPLEPQTESKQEEKAGPGHEVEMAPDSKAKEEESQQDMRQTGGTCEIESEGEDFTIALEHPETATASVTTMEWD